MMIIDIRQLNAKKEYFGSLCFEYSAPESLIGIPFVKFASPVTVSFDYELFADDSLEVKGTVSYAIEGNCSRCLKETKVEIVGELDALFQPKIDSEDYSYVGSKIDLTGAVEDAIMASMPYVLSCGEDCQGIVYSDEPNQSEE